MYEVIFFGYVNIGDIMFWSVEFPKFHVPSFSKKLDVAIIGGGITGLTTAYYLKDSNLKIGLFDKGKVASGVTSKTTAKITYLQGDIYQRLGSRAKKYFLSQKEAISELIHIIEKEHIDCDLEQVVSVLFTLDKANIYKLDEEKRLLQQFGCYPFDIIDSHIEAGFGIRDSYVFHPLKYLKGLCKTLLQKIDFYEDILVQNIQKNGNFYVLKTTSGIFEARDVVVCCHYPFFLLPSYIPLKTYVEREYVNVCKMKEHKHFSAINIDSELHSVRYYKNYLIYGSNQSRLTSKINYSKNYQKSIADFEKYFKKEPQYTWMNQDIVSNDLLPFIGKVCPHLFIGTAYRAWGMTNGTLAGKILADSILNRKNQYITFFDPKRMNMSLFYHSFLGTFHYMKVYAQSLWKKNNPFYIRINGIIYAIYEDEEHEIHRIRLLCPHMKCNLVFNSFEKTWDCPCHGSRFDLDGKLLEGPAKEDLKH